MALIKCPECGKEISDQAPACIHCGFPLKTNAQQVLQPVVSVAPTTGSAPTMKTWKVGDPNIEVECDKCGKVFLFEKRWFQSIGKTSSVPKVPLRCPNCGNQTPAGITLPASGGTAYSCTPSESSSAIKCPKRGKEASEQMKRDQKRMILKQIKSVSVDIVCGFCGQRMTFGKRSFQKITETSVVPRIPLSCSRCTMVAPAGEPLTPGKIPSYRPSPSSTPRCPNCGSENIQPMKKGFSAGKAVAGGLLLGPVGLLGGAVGSNDVIRVCAKCGHKF